MTLGDILVEGNTIRIKNVYENPLHKSKLLLTKHLLGEKYVQYHHDVIFNSMIEKIARNLKELSKD